MEGSSQAESLWRARLRWRLRGALLWPAFFVFTALDALLLGRLPIAGDGGTAFVPAALLAAFFNLVAVAVVAPFAGMLLRRRRRDLPKVVADDYAGAALVAGVTLVLLAGGLVHRPHVADARHDLAVSQHRGGEVIAREAPPEFRARVAQTDTLKLDDELYRTCAPGDDPKRWFCVYVATDMSPPGVRVDENRESNASLNAPGGFR